jgi:hypothetical protein
MEKYAMEYMRVCGTMGCRDIDVGNLSAEEYGGLGPVKIRIKQLIQEEETLKWRKKPRGHYQIVCPKSRQLS